MLKKLAVAGASVALLAVTAMPAFADWSGLNLTNNAVLFNTVNTSSNTGNNYLKSWEDELNGGSIHTGNALSQGQLGNVVNSNSLSDIQVGFSEDWGGLNVANGATLYNTVNTSSNTGSNYIKGEGVDGGSIVTGGAGAGSVVTNVVNTNVLHDVGVGYFPF